MTFWMLEQLLEHQRVATVTSWHVSGARLAGKCQCKRRPSMQTRAAHFAISVCYLLPLIPSKPVIAVVNSQMTCGNAGGFFDGTTDATERHAFLVQLLQGPLASEHEQGLATTAAEVCALSKRS